MKKYLFILVIAGLFSFDSYSQCVFSCYTYSQSQITFSAFPSTGPDAISQFAPSIDDGITGPIPLGFNFNYYCNTYSTVLICSNGFLQFDFGSPPNLTFANPAQSFPDPTSPNGIVALNMNDLDPNMGGSITYTTIGTTPNQKFILTYSNVPIWSFNTSLNTGQIVLYEGSNIIEIHTDNINLSNTNIYSGTQGIENESGTQGSAVSGRNNTVFQVTTPSAYRWTPIATYTPVPPATITGTQTACEGTTHSFTVNPMPGATSYNWSLPAFWIGSSSVTAITATTGISGLLSVSATYSCGTSSPTTYSVNVLPSPVVAITSVTPAVFCSGPTVTITTSGAATYTVNPGNYTGTPPFYDTPNMSVTYSVMGTDTSGCVSKNAAMVQISVKETPTVTVNSGSICSGESFTMQPGGAASYNYSSVFNVVTPTLQGIYNYSVTGTGTNGCVGAVVVSTVTVFKTPQVLPVSSRNDICAKETISLTANGAVSYTWGTNSTATVIVFKPTITTTYSLLGMDANGCVSSGSITVKVSSCVGIEEQISGKQALIYPNPSNGVFNIQLSEPSHITVYNLIGQKLIDADFNAGQQMLDLSEYSSGKYIVTVSGRSGQSQYSIIKE